MDQGLKLFCGDTPLLISRERVDNNTVLSSRYQVIQPLQCGRGTVSSHCTSKQYLYNPCKQRIKRNSHPFNNWPVLKRSILKLLKRRYWAENNHSIVKKNDYFSEQTVTAGQTGKREKDGIKQNSSDIEKSRIYWFFLLFSPPRWTPPMPPVTNTGIPALCAAIMVPDTVVPPDKPCQGTTSRSQHAGWPREHHMEAAMAVVYHTATSQQPAVTSWHVKFWYRYC